MLIGLVVVGLWYGGLKTVHGVKKVVHKVEHVIHKEKQ